MSQAVGFPTVRTGLHAALAALAGLALLTLAMRLGYTAGFDRQVLTLFAALRGLVPDAFFRTVTWLGSGYVLAPATVLLVAALGARRQWVAARLLGLTYFAASLTTWLLKPAIGRERPGLFPALTEIASGDLSFPSGHATHAAAWALGLWLLTVRFQSRRRIAVAFALGVWVVLVGASRLQLQVHWPSDVLAGLLVAAFWGGLAFAVSGRDHVNRSLT